MRDKSDITQIDYSNNAIDQLQTLKSLSSLRILVLAIQGKQTHSKGQTEMEIAWQSVISSSITDMKVTLE